MSECKFQVINRLYKVESSLNPLINMLLLESFRVYSNKSLLDTYQAIRYQNTIEPLTHMN